MKHLMTTAGASLALVTLLALMAPRGPVWGAMATAPAPAPGADPRAALLPPYPQEAPDGRLPPHARPEHYALALTIDPRTARFSGEVRITIALATPLHHLWLHGNGLNVMRVRVEALGAASDESSAAGNPQGVRTGAGPASRAFEGSWQQVLATGVARVDFGERPVGPGRIRLTITYDAPFDRNLAGLFAVEEQGDHYALAKSESIQARRFLPGFDEPGFKAPFDIALTVPAGYAAISNAPERAREPAGEGMERVTFATTRPLSTYLLSLAVGPFDVVERPPIPGNSVRDEPLPLRGIARRGRGEALAYVLEITPAFVRIFEESLRSPYPYEKLDIVAAPQWPSGATELAAAISYREQRILVDGTPPPAVRRALIAVHAHEIAHMWFGNVVTPPWWDDLWLKEGFATWATPFVLTQWEPDAGHAVTARARTLRAMAEDSLASVRRVREPISANADIRNAYTSIPYSKGAALIAMADAYFGAEIFRPALGRYVERFADGAADSDQFFEAIGEATGEPALTESFRSFVEQAGVPLVDASLDCAEGVAPMIRLRQRRYRPLGSGIEEERRWVIPVCLAWAGSTGAERERRCTLLRDAQAVMPLRAGQCPAWLLPNADGAGYYRYSLSDDGWAELIAAMPRLEATEALTVVDSAMAAFEAGRLSDELLFAVVTAAARADHRLVVTAPLGRLARYADRVLDPAPARALLAWVGDRYRPRLAALAWARSEEERLLRSDLARFLALTVQDPPLRRQLAADAAAFVGLGEGEEPDPGALDADRYDMALRVAVQEFGAPFVDAMLVRRETLDDPRFEASAVEALGHARDPALRARARELALGGTFGPRETYALIDALFEHPAARAAAWDWYRRHFDQIVELIPAQWRRRTPNVGRYFCDPAEAAELKALFAERGALVPGHERQLRQVLEQIALCGALREEVADQLRPPRQTALAGP